MTEERRARVGVFGIGLEAYWEQFDGLEERLKGYQRSESDGGPRSSLPASYSRESGKTETNTKLAS